MPLSIHGTVVTIRKFAKTPLLLDDLVHGLSLTRAMADFLVAAVKCRLNILISGGTGSGKTTLLAAAARAIPEQERLVTIEDMAELNLGRSHVVGLEARPANVEGRGEVTIRMLLKNALRMRPDRIIVGEVRGGEALDMLQAMNTGHEGSLTTIHANSAADAITRLEAMVMMSGVQLPLPVIREHLVSTLDLVVQVARLPDGRRRVVAVAEVVGVADGRVVLQDLFRYDQEGVAADGGVLGRFTATAVLPRCYPRLLVRGVAPPPATFGVAP